MSAGERVSMRLDAPIYLAIRGVAGMREQPGQIVTTRIEHPASEQPCAWLERRGWQVTRIGV